MSRPSQIPLITSRLEKLKVTGPREWVACCPAHDDQHPSFNLRETDDGRILMHCHAGCSTEAILGALGLTFDVLFAEPLGNLSPIKHPFSPAAVLKALAFEATVIAIAARDAADGRLTEEDRQRMLLAAGRIIEGVRYA